LAREADGEGVFLAESGAFFGGPPPSEQRLQLGAHLGREKKERKKERKNKGGRGWW
jgi:hypothetical protein